MCQNNTANGQSAFLFVFVTKFSMLLSSWTELTLKWSVVDDTVECILSRLWQYSSVSKSCSYEL